MDLYVNQKNCDKLNFIFLRRYARLLFNDHNNDVINLRPDFNSNSLIPFRILVLKFLDLMRFSYSLNRWMDIGFRFKLLDVPYCVLPCFPKEKADYLIENNAGPDKIKLDRCQACKYKNLCGGISNIYLKKYGDREFRAVSDIPFEIMIEVDSRCNLNCRHCFNRNTFAKNGRSLPFLRTEVIKETIEEISRLKISSVRFTGGEPMLRPDIYELLEFAKNKGLYTILNSNGILIDETAAQKLNGLADTVLISIQGTGKEGDDAVGKEGATKAKIEAITNLKKFTRTKITIATVLRPEIMKENGRELDKIRKLFDDLQISPHWHLCRCIPEKKEFYHEEKQDYIKLADKLLNWQLGKAEYHFSNYPFVISNGIPFCLHDKIELIDSISYGGLYNDGYTRLSIDPEGAIKPIYYSPLTLSENPRDISGAWNHPFLKKIRNLELLPVACQDCFYKRKCLGGARFWAHLLSGDYSAPDPLMPPQKLTLHD